MTQSVLPKSAVNRASPSADAATQLESASNNSDTSTSLWQ